MQISPEEIAAHTIGVIREMDLARTPKEVADVERAYQRWAAANYVADGIRRHIEDKAKLLTRTRRTGQGGLSQRSRAMAGESAE